MSADGSTGAPISKGSGASGPTRGRPAATRPERVALFVPCYVDQFFPRVARAFVIIR